MLENAEMPHPGSTETIARVLEAAVCPSPLLKNAQQDVHPRSTCSSPRGSYVTTRIEIREYPHPR